MDTANRQHQKITLFECLLTMELLWDSLMHNETELESPDWHQKILSERKKNLNLKKIDTFRWVV